ncbi:MAG TPA: dockerin type I domain-containing protein [Phycisphaerae bacterium]|nr:dockerin type I domain-containing protein [Phycisphaerae bacterium]HNU44209.1 dockerin type I domain-containing protein [Phycisphaerae bacterium]
MTAPGSMGVDGHGAGDTGPLPGGDVPTLLLRLSDDGGYLCTAPGAEFSVILSLRHPPGPVVGYQAFVRFDADDVTFVRGTYSHPDPFAVLFAYPIAAVDGQITLAAGILPGIQPPLTHDADLATLTFLAISGAVPTVVELPSHNPPSRLILSDDTLVLPRLVDSPWIVPVNGPPDPCGCFRPDVNTDGRVDADDFGLLWECLSGPQVTPPAGGCDCADLDADGDVDLADVARLQWAFSG